jgi:hypothetical protein
VPKTDANDPWESYNGDEEKLVNEPCCRWRANKRATKNRAYLKFLVPLQNLRAQRKVAHRALVIVVNDAAFPDRCLCPRLALSLVRDRRAWRLCELYAL